MVKRDRDSNVVQTLRDIENLHKILERKAELAVRRENAAQNKVSEAETEMEKEKFRSSQKAFFETHRALESQRMHAHQANQWADQAQGEKKISEGN